MRSDLFSRRTLLRVMLYSLGLGALAGIIGVLLGAQEVVSHIMWTGFAAGIAAAIMIPMSFMVDREAARPAGLFGLAAMVGVFLLALIPIWELGELVHASMGDQNFALTALFLFLLTFPTMAFWRLTTTSHSQLAGWVGVATGGVTFVLVLAAIWAPDFFWYAINWSDRPYDELWSTPWAVGNFGVLASLCLAGMNNARWWRWLGVATAAVACAFLLMMIWGDNQLFNYRYVPDWRDKVLAVFTSITVFVALANLLMLVALRPEHRFLRMLTIAAGATTAILADLLVLYDIGFDDLDSMIERFTGAAAIFTVCGALGTIILARLNRAVDVSPGSPMPAELTLICPRCRRKHTLPVGNARCPTCDLRFHIRLEEPRCPQCGYLLYGLTSPQCPECGHTIAPPAATTA